MVDSTSSDRVTWKEMLIAEVEKFPCLYATKMGRRVTREEKWNSWVRVGNAMKSEALFCKTNWLKLRDTYCRHVKTTRDSNGAFISSWKFYEHMRFVEPHIFTFGITQRSNANAVATEIVKRKPGRPRKNILACMDTTLKTSNNVENANKKGRKEPVTLRPRRTVRRYCESCESCVPSPKLEEVDEFVLPDSFFKETRLAPPPLANGTVKQETQTVDPKEVIMQTPAPTESQQQMSPPVMHNDYDEEYFFGMNVACKLRQMTPINKALAQAEIREKLLQIEFGVPFRPDCQ